MRIFSFAIILLIALGACSSKDPKNKYPSVNIMVRAENSAMQGISGSLTIRDQKDTIDENGASFGTNTYFNRYDKVSVKAQLKNPTSDSSMNKIIFMVYTKVPKVDTIFYAIDTVSIDTSYTFLK